MFHRFCKKKLVSTSQIPLVVQIFCMSLVIISSNVFCLFRWRVYTCTGSQTNAEFYNTLTYDHLSTMIIRCHIRLVCVRRIKMAASTMYNTRARFHISNVAIVNFDPRQKYARKKPEKRSRAPSISARGKNGKGAASLAYARWKIG